MATTLKEMINEVIDSLKDAQKLNEDFQNKSEAGSVNWNNHRIIADRIDSALCLLGYE